MNETYNKNLKNNAQKLRRKMTKEESHLWYDFLKKLPATINRQKIIGNYIVDFYCAKAKTAIELDGSQHYDKEGRSKDIKRDDYLKKQGIKVLRYSNYDVNKHFEAVCSDIMKNLNI